MRKLFAFLLILVALMGVGELLAARFAENEIEERVAEEVEAEVEAEVASFPLVTRVLATEEVKSMSVTLTNVDFDEIDFDTLRIEASGIALPRKRLLDGNMRPTGISSGSVTAFVSTAALSDAIGTSLPTLDPATSAHLQDGTLTVEIPGIPPLSVSVPGEALPCSGTGEVRADGVHLRCEVDQIPDIVLENLPN